MSDTDDAVVGESSDAQVDELNSLLSDFDQPDQTGTEPKKITSDDVREVVDYVRDTRQKDEMKETNDAIDHACKTVYDALSEEAKAILPERATRGLLIDMADSDRRFQRAFLERNSNPSQWNKILNAKAKELSTEFTPQVDRELSDDKEAIASAVRSASTKAPEPPEDEAKSRQKIRQMSDQELRALKRSLGGY